ncbi:hypothetical protein PV04_02908 [Phialophora macrospora]|uniref:Swi5-domain-containing protein n=1 Tax=Phialophora macrospora TaxID=1851006 RepID=A0A0D2FQP7_9EURO|nr:hypothetical protein PV04_02908 [Phialophora macrospora]
MDSAREPVPPGTRTHHNPHRRDIIASSDISAEAEDSEQSQDNAHTGHNATPTTTASVSSETSQNCMPPPPIPRQAKLQTKISTLQSTIAAMETQLALKLQKITQLKSFPSQERGERERKQEIGTASPSPTPAQAQTQAQDHAQSIMTQHIVLLKRYNEIKDIASWMLSLIAEKEGKRLAEVMAERGLSERD